MLDAVVREQEGVLQEGHLAQVAHEEPSGAAAAALLLALGQRALLLAPPSPAQQTPPAPKGKGICESPSTRLILHMGTMPHFDQRCFWGSDPVGDSTLKINGF